MALKPTSSLASIEEEESPNNQQSGNIPSDAQIDNSYSFGQQESFSKISFNYVAAQEISPQKSLSSRSSVSPISPFSFGSNENIEIKKFQLMQKYKSSPVRKFNWRIFQNQLKQKLKDCKNCSSNSQLKATKSLNQINVRRSKVRHSSLNLPQKNMILAKGKEKIRE